MKKLLKRFFVVLIAVLSLGLVSCGFVGGTPEHEHEKCPDCGLCTAEDCNGTVAEKCPGHQAPEHQHTVCPECGKCTAADCDGAAEDKCAGHQAPTHQHTACPECGKCTDPECDGNDKCEGHVVEPTALATPGNFAYDSATQVVSWGTVEGAIAYKVTAVKTGTELTVIEEQTITETSVSVVNLPAKEITVKVQALVATADETHKDSEVASYAFEIAAVKLTTPAELKAENDILSFAEVANSDCYLVQVFKADDLDNAVLELVDTIETTLSLESLGHGQYVAKVTAYAPLDSLYYADSEVATLEFEIASLGDLQTPAITGIVGGNIVWAANNARDYAIEIVRRGTTEAISIDGIEVENNKFMLAGLDAEDGDYTFSIKALSNRHNQAESAVATYDFTIQTAKAFDAEAIAQFNGAQGTNNTGGEHGKAELVEVNGVKYGLVTPTADGWGRVASPEFTVNFNNNPVLFLEMGSIFGGFHVQITHDGTLYSALNDTLKEGNIAVSLNGIKTESGNVFTATGIQTIVIRLGVDNSTTTTANDAKAHYHAVKVVYIKQYEEPTLEEAQLAAPTDLGISESGLLSWKGVENATHYAVLIADKATGTAIKEVETDSTNIVGYELAAGDYTITVKAINKTNPLFTASEEVSYNFTVAEVVKYTGAQMSTFVSGGGDNPQIQLNSDDTITLNPNGLAGWGWIWDTNGVTIDLDKNPLVIVKIEKSNEGGYLARATYNGFGTIVMANDTAGAFDTQKTLVFRASKNVDGNPQGAGVVEGYKFGIGVRGHGEIVVSSIRILTITEYKEAVSEEVKLAAPQNLGINNNSEIKWDSVEDATAYKVVVKKGEEVVDEMTTIRSVYSVATLPVGQYSILVSAVNPDNALILDSDAAEYKFEVSEAVSYTAEQIAAFVKGDGDGDVRAELDSETGHALYNPDKKGWGWLYPEVGATVDMSKNPFIVVTVESVEAGYLARATYDGAGTIVMMNDTNNPLSEQTVLVMRANVNVDGNPVTNQVVEGYKFGFGFINGSINAVSNIRIIYVTPIE